jgi:hypothetical protein
MPPNPDHIAQVEAALRQRFFALVPDEAGGDANVEERDTNRLSKALAAFALAGLCNLDDAAAAQCITDGTNDGDIDSLHFDRVENRLIAVQAKFKRNGKAPNQAETLKTINGVKALRERRFTQFNPHFQNKLDEIEEALDTPGVKVIIAFVHLGENLDTHAHTDITSFVAEANAVTELFSWEDLGLNTVHGWLVDLNAPNAVDITVTLESWKCVGRPRKALYGQISAASLADLSNQHGKPLFQRNIRHYLGTVGVNRAIADTVRNQPGDLFYLNNGITMVAEAIVQSPGDERRCVFQFRKASIVNGAQTAGSMVTAANAGTISPDARLLITIIEIGPDDELGIRITRARNHQNVVRGIDFAALDPTQERIRRELATAAYRYFYRPSAEARIPSNASFTVEEAALALACLRFPLLLSTEVTRDRARGRRVNNAVDYVVAAKKEISRLWDQGGDIYPQLFSGDISGLRVCRYVRVFRTIDNVLAASERAETGYFRRMFFRHGRYFIAAFVAQRCPDLINRSAHELSAAEQTELSRQINEISEIIYAESESLQGYKGYLAIFRNLTDAQPLADSVIRRLATPAPEAVAEPTPSPAETEPPAEAAPGEEQGSNE